MLIEMKKHYKSKAVFENYGAMTEKKLFFNLFISFSAYIGFSWVLPYLFEIFVYL